MLLEEGVCYEQCIFSKGKETSKEMLILVGSEPPIVALHKKCYSHFADEEV